MRGSRVSIIERDSIPLLGLWGCYVWLVEWAKIDMKRGTLVRLPAMTDCSIKVLLKASFAVINEQKM